MVEHHLAKVDVEGSNPFARSTFLVVILIVLTVKASDLFSLPESLPFEKYFLPEANPWDWVVAIAEALNGFDFGKSEKRGDMPQGLVIEGAVYIHPTVKLPPYGYIQGPAYIGANTELRPGVYIRGNVIVGENCVLGNSCEYKNCLLMDNVQTPHFNYVGDSVLGSGSHLAAGVVLANLRLDHQNVAVDIGKEKVQTNLKKLGSMIGEKAEVGCNSVLQPGTVLCKGVLVGSCVALGGFVAEGKRVFTAAPVVK